MATLRDEEAKHRDDEAKRSEEDEWKKRHAAELKRQDDHAREEFEKALQQVTAIFERNNDLVDKFLAIAYSKVSILDEYGDEDWEALPAELRICLKKIANREQLSFDWKLFDPQIACQLRQAIDDDDQYEKMSTSGRGWFCLLLTVQGVDAEVARAILSTLSPGELATAVAMRDKAAIMRAPGVGPKVAERIVTALAALDPTFIPLSNGVEDKRTRSPVAAAVSALVNLGYEEPQAMAAVSAAVRSAGEGADVARLIRLGLKELAKDLTR